MKLFSLLMACGLAYTAYSMPRNTVTTLMDGPSNKMYKALIARIDQLEEKSISRDRMYQTKITQLLEEHRRHTDQSLRDHQTQIDKLRHDYVSELDSLRHDMLQQKNRINELEKMVQRQEGEKTIFGSNDGIEAPTESVSSKHEVFGVKTMLNESIDTDDAESKEPNASENNGDSSSGLLKKSVHPGKRIRQVEPDMEVAFYATLSVDQQNLGHNQDISFDHVVINKGNGYNPYAGIFIAPVAGTYVFSVSLTTLGSHTTHYGMFKNADQITVLFVNGGMNNYDGASQTSILHLDKGDSVSIKHTETNHDLAGNNHTMFSGFLLYQDFTDSTPAIIGK